MRAAPTGLYGQEKDQKQGEGLPGRVDSAEELSRASRIQNLLHTSSRATMIIEAGLTGRTGFHSIFLSVLLILSI
jgi:hypothetical protein